MKWPLEKHLISLAFIFSYASMLNDELRPIKQLLSGGPAPLDQVINLIIHSVWTAGKPSKNK